MRKYCSECGKELNEGDLRCDSCGGTPKVEKPSDSASGGRNISNVYSASNRRCSKCGKPLNPLAVRCPNCGTNVDSHANGRVDSRYNDVVDDEVDIPLCILSALCPIHGIFYVVSHRHSHPKKTRACLKAIIWSMIASTFIGLIWYVVIRSLIM